MLRVLLSVGALQFAAMFVMMLRTKGLALLLGPEQFGLMAALDRLVAVFAQTASLSMPFAALRYLSPLWHDHRAEYLELLRRMRTILLWLLSAALVVGIALTWLAPGTLGHEVAGDRALATLALAGLPVVAFVPFLQNAVASSFVHNRAMLFMILHAVVITVAALGGVWLWGLRGFYGLYAVLGGALVFVVARRVQRGREDAPSTSSVDLAREGPTADRGSEVDLEAGATPPMPTPGSGLTGYLPPLVWRFCLLLLPSAFLTPAVAYAVFYLVLSTHGNDTAGYMQAAIGISLAVRGVLGAASQVFLTPLVNRSGTFADRMERATEFHKTLFLLVGVSVPPIVLLSDLAVRALYSSEFLPGAPFVALFVSIEVLALAVGTYQAVLVAMEHIVWYVAQNALAQLAMYAVAFATVSALGITGAGLAMLAAPVLILLGTLGYLARRYGIGLPVRLLSLSLYVLLVLGAGGLLASARPGLGLSALVVKGSFYVVTTALLALFLDRQDWRNLRAFVHEGVRLGRADPAADGARRPVENGAGP